MLLHQQQVRLLVTTMCISPSHEQETRVLQDPPAPQAPQDRQGQREQQGLLALRVLLGHLDQLDPLGHLDLQEIPAIPDLQGQRDRQVLQEPLLDSGLLP